MLLLPVGGAQARASPSPLAEYARARIAPDAKQAAESFSATLVALPNDPTIALRAYREAIVSGNYALALRAALTLERTDRLPPEARLLIYIDALRSRDGRTAARRLNELAREPSLAFIAPTLAEWLRFGSSETLDLSGIKDIGGPNAYAQESAALLALAQGETQTGVDIIRTLWTLDPYRAQSLRLAAAATLAARKQPDAARALLDAETLSTTVAKARIGRGEKLGIAVNTALSGTAFILARLAGDLTVEGSGTGAITLARFAHFADPKNARLALGVAGALAGAKRNAAALAAVEPLITDPLYGDDAQSLRIELLEALGRSDEAMAAAQARAGRSANDAARLGDMAMRRRDYADAARRFDAAIAGGGTDVSWTLWHAAGNAHLMAGDWAAGRTALETAYRLAPDEPLVLNSLGFGLVDRGVDVVRGKALIDRAAELRPGSASIIDSQGWAAYRAGDFARAIAALERARLLQPVEAEITEHLGDAYWAAGRKIEARYAWAAARVQGDDTAHGRLDAKIDRGFP